MIQNTYFATIKSVLRSRLNMIFLLLIPSALFCYFRPILCAYVCPACFGFVEASPGFYIDRNVRREVSVITEKFRISKAEIDRKFDLNVSSAVLMCFSEKCHTRMGRVEALGLTYGVGVSYLSPSGINQTIIKHELSHLAMIQKMGPMRMYFIPTWLDEGIAVIASNDLRYIGSNEYNRYDCRDFNAREMPNNTIEWWSESDKDHVITYSKAAFFANCWLGSRDLLSGIESLSRVVPWEINEEIENQIKS